MWLVWRVAAPDFEVDAFLKAFPELRPGVVWHRGEASASSRRPPREDSGFSVQFPDAETIGEALSICRKALERWAPALKALGARGVASTLDVGLSLDLPETVARFVRFSADELRWLADLGIELEISVYAAREDAGE